MRPGPRNLITDISGLRVGNAQDDRIKTGTTVLLGDAPFVASVAVMGGAPGTRETDLLAPDKSVSAVDALVLSGGSAFGLAAAQGVMDGLHAMGRGFTVHGARVPIVPAAIIFDLVNGGEKLWADNPYPGLGQTALSAAGPDFSLGSAGAGTGAMTAMHKGGLGSASVMLDKGITVGALVVVNPMGSPVTPSGQHFWSAAFEMGSEFGGLGPDPATGYRPQPVSKKAQAMASFGRTSGVQEGGNTTIAVVATDARLDKAQCHRLAVAAHDGLGRAILPAHTPFDGDLIFAASTGVAPLDSAADMAVLCHAASLCLSRAIARGVWEATPATSDLLPCFQTEIRDA